MGHTMTRKSMDTQKNISNHGLFTDTVCIIDTKNRAADISFFTQAVWQLRGHLHRSCSNRVLQNHHIEIFERERERVNLLTQILQYCYNSYGIHKQQNNKCTVYNYISRKLLRSCANLHKAHTLPREPRYVSWIGRVSPTGNMQMNRFFNWK